MGLARRNWLGRALAGLVLTAVLALGFSPSSWAADLPTVKLGTLRLVGGAPIFIALEKGYFEQEGVNVEVEWFSAAAPIATAVAAGSIDVGATGITGALFNSIGGGAGIYLVADRGSERDGYPLNAMVVNAELYEKGEVRSLQDLKGRKVGLTTLGSTYHYQLGRLFELEGMSLDDVEVVPLRTMGIVIDSLKQGTIAAAILSPPWGSAAEVEGWGKRLFWASEKMSYQTTGVFYSERLVKRDRDLGLRFMKGYLRGVQHYFDAVFRQGEGPAYEEVLQIVADYTQTDRESVAHSLTYIDPLGRVDTEDLMIQQDWYKRQGMIERIVPVEEFVDMSFVEEAARALGLQ